MAGLPTILLAEDETAVRDVVIRMLTDRGFRVFAAASGHEALRIIEAQQVDLLFADIVMPGMDGVELARRAKALRPKLKVLFATGYAQRAVERLARQQGHVLLKPVRAAEMVREIETLLATR